jgi:SAM-dependent methyltransferase
MTDRSEATCPVCGDESAAFLAAKNGYPLFRCPACGLIFVHPMPSEDALAAVYCAEEGTISESFYPKAQSRWRRALVKASRFVRYVRGKDVIDVGCGGGFMVEAMRRAGGRAVGLDISPQSIAYARRQYPENEFFCEGLEEFARRNRTFDFIYSSEVLEHLPDINSAMAALARIARPGGHLFVTTPDIGHWRVPKDVLSWELVNPPLHLQYFSRDNLRLLFERHGFTVRKRLFKLKPGLQVVARRS